MAGYITIPLIVYEFRSVMSIYLLILRYSSVEQKSDRRTEKVLDLMATLISSSNEE